MSPGLSHPWPVSQSLVPRSKPLVRPDLLHSHRPSLCSTPVYHKPRNMLHKHHTHAMVCIQTQPKLDHHLTITHHQSTNMDTYQPYVRSKHSETNCGTITNTSELLISGRLLMPLCLPFVTLLAATASPWQCYGHRDALARSFVDPTFTSPLFSLPHCSSPDTQR